MPKAFAEDAALRDAMLALLLSCGLRVPAPN
jgi:hypothetical protein